MSWNYGNENMIILKADMEEYLNDCLRSGKKLEDVIYDFNNDLELFSKCEVVSPEEYGTMAELLDIFPNGEIPEDIQKILEEKEEEYEQSRKAKKV